MSPQKANYSNRRRSSDYESDSSSSLSCTDSCSSSSDSSDSECETESCIVPMPNKRAMAYGTFYSAEAQCVKVNCGFKFQYNENVKHFHHDCNSDAIVVKVSGTYMVSLKIFFGCPSQVAWFINNCPVKSTITSGANQAVETNILKLKECDVLTLRNYSSKHKINTYVSNSGNAKPSNNLIATFVKIDDCDEDEDENNCKRKSCSPKKRSKSCSPRRNMKKRNSRSKSCSPRKHQAHSKSHSSSCSKSKSRSCSKSPRRRDRKYKKRDSSRSRSGSRQRRSKSCSPKRRSGSRSRSVSPDRSPVRSRSGSCSRSPSCERRRSKSCSKERKNKKYNYRK